MKTIFGPRLVEKLHFCLIGRVSTQVRWHARAMRNGAEWVRSDKFGNYRCAVVFGMNRVAT